MLGRGGCDQGRWDSGLIGMERQTNKFDKPGLSTKIYSIIIKSRRKREKQKKNKKEQGVKLVRQQSRVDVNTEIGEEGIAS